MNETYKTTIFHTKSNYFFGSILNFSRLFDAIQIRNYFTVCRLRSKCYFSLASREIRLIHTFFNVLLIFAQSQCFKSFRFDKYQIFTGKCLPLPLKSNNLFPIPCTQFSHEIHVRGTLRFSRIEMNWKFYFPRSFLMHVCTDLGLLDNWLGRRIVSIEHSTVCYYVLLVLFVYFPQHFFFCSIVCNVDSIFTVRTIKTSEQTIGCFCLLRIHSVQFLVFDIFPSCFVVRFVWFGAYERTHAERTSIDDLAPPSLQQYRIASYGK